MYDLLPPIIPQKRLPHKVKPHAAASRYNSFPVKNIESSFAYFSFKKSKTYFSMTSFVSRAIIETNEELMIARDTKEVLGNEGLL